MGILEAIRSLSCFEIGVLVFLALETMQILSWKKYLIDFRWKLQDIRERLLDLSVSVAASAEERIKNEKVLAMMLEWVTDLERKSKK